MSKRDVFTRLFRVKCYTLMYLGESSDDASKHGYTRVQDSKVLRNIGILPHHYTVSQTRRPRSSFRL